MKNLAQSITPEQVNACLVRLQERRKIRSLLRAGMRVQHVGTGAEFIVESIDPFDKIVHVYLPKGNSDFTQPFDIKDIKLV
jgi:hypothetical protein